MQTPRVRGSWRDRGGEPFAWEEGLGRMLSTSTGCSKSHTSTLPADSLPSPNLGFSPQDTRAHHL